MNGGARDQLRRLSVLIAIALVDMIGFAIIFPILPFYVLELKATPFKVGVIAAGSISLIAATLMHYFIELPGGRWVRAMLARRQNSAMLSSSPTASCMVV